MLPSYLNETHYNGFEPIGTFKRTDADVTLWVLKNRAIYTGKVEDPFFKATTPYRLGAALLFTTDFDVSVLACTEQYSFCNSVDCTTFNGLLPITAGIVRDTLNYNPAQMATFDVIWRAAWSSRAFTILFNLGASALLANSQSVGTIRSSTILPSNQWQLEVASVFNITLAYVQRLVVQIASPANVQFAPDQTIYEHIIPPSTKEQKSMCNNQKIMSGPGYYSFNFFGLLTILVSGSVLIAISNAFPAIRHRQLKTTDARGQHRLQEWKGNDLLQLQRRALEARGLGTWSDEGDVPIMMPGYMTFKLPWLADAEYGSSSEHVYKSFLTCSNGHGTLRGSIGSEHRESI